MSRLTRGLFTSNTDEWATPQAVFDELNHEFGFTLDACATAENAKCPNYYTRQTDGLRQNWGGKSSFATHHTARLSKTGCGNVTRKAASQIRGLLCSYPPEQIPHIFTTTSTTRRERCGSCVVGFILTMRQTVRHFRV